MNNEEYVKRLGKLYDEVMSLRKDDDYIVNQPQMEKFIDILDFFNDMVEESSGHVEAVELVPKEENGGITAKFVIFDLYGGNIKRFCDVIQHCSAMTIDTTLKNEVCISVTIPEVFKRK